MPTTTVNSDGTTVTVEVVNTMPGGRVHSVGAICKWDPSVLTLGQPNMPGKARLLATKGTCVWTGVDIDPRRKKSFTLKVRRRRKKDETHILGCSVDAAHGTFSRPHSFTVPAEPRRASPR